jgi:hypothetical protein
VIAGVGVGSGGVVGEGLGVGGIGQAEIAANRSGAAKYLTILPHSRKSLGRSKVGIQKPEVQNGEY